MCRRITVRLGVILISLSAFIAIIVGVNGTTRGTSLPNGKLVVPAQPAADRRNILLVCVDTLRADHVGLYGYHRATTPRIDAFFRSGRVFEYAYATAPVTTPSMVSALTGLYPHRHGMRLLMQRISPEVNTVVDDLRRGGYETAAIISNAVLTHEASGLGDRFDFYDDAVDEREPFREEMLERNAARTTDAAIDWLRQERDNDRPHFLWVHYIDPHGPYRPPADKPADFAHDVPVTIDPDRVPEYGREPGLTDGAEYVDRYDEEIAYTDREVGRLLDEYARLGLAESAAIILSSDHGESLMEHEHWFRHQMNVYEEMVRVPLAIRNAGVASGRVSVPVSNADIGPTILALAALPVPRGLDGRSLLGEIVARDILCEGRADGGGLWRGLINRRHKTAVRHGMSNVIRESRAFDLRTDPGELRPLPVSDGDPTLTFLVELIASDPDPGGVPQGYDAGELPAPGVAEPLSDDMRRRLESLGYIGGG